MQVLRAAYTLLLQLKEIIMTIRNTLAASALILTTAFAGIASASISTGSLGIDVQSAAGSGHVGVILKDGVATLTGGVDSQVEANAAELAPLTSRVSTKSSITFLSPTDHGCFMTRRSQ